MVGCCKFGPCRKKRTYEFNNPPYTANKEGGVYHSHRQKLTDNESSAVKNGSGPISRTNPAFESRSADNLEFNGAAVVDLDSECNSIAEDGVVRKDSHKENIEGFKTAVLVVAGEGVKRKDSKRSSKSSHSSSSSSSKGSKRSSKHSDVVNDEDRHSEHVEIVETVKTDYTANEVDADQIETHIVTTTTTTKTETHHEHVEEIEGGAVAYPDDDDDSGDDKTSNDIVVVKREVIAETIVDGEVTNVEIKEEVTVEEDEATSERRNSDSSHSSKSSSSSDANSYQINEDEPIVIEEENKEEVIKVQDDYSSEAVEAPPGIEELDNVANDRVQEISGGTCTVTVTEEVSVNAHGDDEGHEGD